MYLASNSCVPPKEWWHDKMTKNKYSQTVGIILSSKGIIPPDEWMHDINLRDYYRNSIKYNLLKHNYFYKDN